MKVNLAAVLVVGLHFHTSRGVNLRNGGETGQTLETFGKDHQNVGTLDQVKSCLMYAEEYISGHPMPSAGSSESEAFGYLLEVIEGIRTLAEKDGMICPPPYTGDETPAVTTNQSVTAEAFPITNNGSNRNAQAEFPESQMNLLPSALCLSGGGNRAFTSNVGQLRALEDLGLMNKFGYMSSVSGGSWASIIYNYYQTGASNDTDLLGSMTEPANLSMDVLNQAPPTMLKPATSDLILIGLSLLLQGKISSPRVLWTESVGATYLKGFGLNDDNFMTLNDNTEAEIKQANPVLGNSSFYKPRPGRPYPVVNAALLSPSLFKGNETVSFQAGPLATGSPFIPNQQKVKYQSLVGDVPLRKLVGGGQLQTFAFGSSKNNKQDTYKLAAPFSLRQIAGASSNAPGYTLQQQLKSSILNPIYNYFPVTDGSISNTDFAFGDGGNIDYSGLIAMLQRGTRQIVVFWNSDVNLANTTAYDACNTSALPTKDQFPSQLGTYFGMQYQSGSGYFNNNHVFNSSMYPKLICEMQKLDAAGKTAAVLQELDVLENDWWGIEKSKRKVKVLFYYLNKAQDFVDQLPQDTQDEIALGSSGAFPNFPNYATYALNANSFLRYTNAQVNLLSSYTQWTIQQTQDLLNQLFN